MAKVPVEIIVKALDKTAPALASMAKRMTALKATANRLNPFSGLTKAIGDSAFGQAARRFGRALGTKAIEGGLTQVQAKFKAFGKTLPDLGKKLLGIGLAGAAIGFALVTSTAESGAALQKMSKQAGVSADWFASTQFAAEQAGVGGEVFGKAMTKLSKQMGEMTVGKGGPLLAFLNEVSPSFARQVKGAKTTDAAMALLGQAFEGIQDPQRRATLAAKVFGDEALQMGEFLHEGNKFIEERRKLFLRLAGSQEQFAASSAAFERSFSLTKLALTGLRNAVATALLPALTTLATTLAEFIAKNRDGIKAWAEKAAAAFQKWADSGGLERLVAGITGIAGAAVTLAEKLGPTGTAIAGIAAVSPTATIAFASLAVSILRLGLTVLPTLISGLWAAGAGLVSFAVTSIPPAIAALSGFAVSAWAAAAPILPFVAAGAVLALTGKAIYDHWDEITYVFKEFGNSLRWAILDTWPKIRPVLEKMSTILGPILGGSFRAALSVGDAVSEQLTPQAAAAAAPSTSQSETRVEVNFSNLPRGARVSTESNADAVDTSLGYSSMVPDA
jgi:hypothetical protein